MRSLITHPDLVVQSVPQASDCVSVDVVFGRAPHQRGPPNLGRLQPMDDVDTTEALRRCRTGKPNRGADCPRRHGGGLVIAEPKSKAGRRLIALPAALVTELREHREAQAKERVMAGSLWRGRN